MKKLDIRFFTLEENQLKKDRKVKGVKAQKLSLTGYISSAGKLVFPNETVANLPIDFDLTTFKVGMQQGKLKAKLLYLVPTQANEIYTFQFEKGANRYTLLLSVILKKSKIDFTQNKYVFTIESFNYEGAIALELQLSQIKTEPKTVVPDKKEGRKPKITE